MTHHATLTKVALGWMHQLKPDRVKGRGGAMSIALPAPNEKGGMALLEALSARRSLREFSPEPIAEQHVSNLLWAAFGVNRRTEKGRTAPTARGAQEIDIYVAMREGLYIYDAFAHKLALVAKIDARSVTGYQDFTDQAPLDLVYVADHAQAAGVAPDERLLHSAVAVGAMVQNVYLYCASAGFATVVRAWLDRKALGEALGLTPDEHIIVAQTLGYPAALGGTQTVARVY
jgi:SagB-type dehydrogenase family enzyme